MTAPATLSPTSRIVSRRGVARSRAGAASRSLAPCRLCHHDCGVNRLKGELGRCRANAQAHVFSAQTEVADELLLIPTFAIAFSGCDLRCDFCITGLESWNPRAGSPLSVHNAANNATHALAQGAKSIMVLGGEPTIHLPSVVELVAELPDTATLAWKTNGHATPQARELLDGLFDYWVVDFKFGNDDCAQRLARIENYTQILRDNLLWAERHSTLIVRHLLMPGHVYCCWEPIARWIANHIPNAMVSLRTGFWPGWRSDRHEEFRQGSDPRDKDRAESIADELGLNLIP